MDQLLNRKILLASIIELQECITQQFWQGTQETTDILLAIQRERLARFDNTGHGDSGTSAPDGGSGESATGDF
jgi:hypothetical protein